jgi:hypothetical protein
MTKTNCRTFEDVTNMEYFYLKEIVLPEKSEIEPELATDYRTPYYGDFAKVIKKTDDRAIIQKKGSPNYCVIENETGLAEGDYLFVIVKDRYDGTAEITYVKTDQQVIKIPEDPEDTDHVMQQVLPRFLEHNEKITVTKVSEMIATIKKEAEKEELARQQRTKTTAKDIIEKQRLWKEESKYDGDITISGGTFSDKRINITIAEQYNTITEYDDIEHLFSYRKNPAEIIDRLIEKGIKKISICYLGGTMPMIDITIFERKSIMNLVPVRKANITKIIRNMRKGTTEEIKVLNQLGVLKLSAVSLESLNIERQIKVPLTIEPINADTFKISLAGLEAEVPWATLKKAINPWNKQEVSGHLNYAEFINVMKGIFGTTKKDILDILKQYKTIGAL